MTDRVHQRRPRIHVVAFMAAMCSITRNAHLRFWLEELLHTAPVVMLGEPS